ncbi:MAG TPA: ATP-dependent DNA helicase PcrA [Planctomycetes bacterium]|nr:ATP-dependent DNA helicase PcrA [Planctomycetota bacterium]
MDYLLEDLNDPQKEAVTHRDGPLLVIAGAGSGKTRVITRRIAWLLAHGVDPRRILGVTFTNKAAREMAGRVEEALPGVRIRLSTFHSACAAFLRRSAPALGFSSDFTIYDTSDRDQLLKSLMKERGVDPKEHRPSQIGAQISSLKNSGVLPTDPEFHQSESIHYVVRRIYEPYQEALRANNAMDFDDLLLKFLRLLQNNPEEKAAYARRFDYLLIDEFQDTNKIQYDIVKLLASEHKNLCVVGDPDQSIYSFRGAVLGNILSFPRDFPGTKVIRLENNYRSTANILAFAQGVIARNRLRYEKVLRPVHGEGEPIGFIEAADGSEEGTLVGHKIRRLLDQGVDPREIAVFYRARFLSREIETCFKNLGIPYRLVGDLGFFQRREVKDLLAFLQVCANPLDRVSFERCLNVPPRGIGQVSRRLLMEEAAREGLPPAEFLRRGMIVPGVRGKAKRGFLEFGKILEEAAGRSLETVQGTLRLFLERTNYLNEICRTGSWEDVDREENVGELLRDAAEFDKRWEELSEQYPDHSPVSAYLAQVSLMTDQEERQADSASVQLMTVHASKGLEFDHVFIVGLEEGLFPHSRSMDDLEGLEEERRLFYVAVTRAKKRLFLCRAERRRGFDGGFHPQQPSSFFQEGRQQLGGGGDPWVYEEDSGELPEFAVGDWVRHARFGEGSIQTVIGRGRNTKVEILFQGGIRTLLVEYAKLEKVEGA